MKRKGFTLIELLVVIAIIGILATIGLVALNGAREKARDATRKSDLSQVKTALVLYADDNENTYPNVSGNTCVSGSGSTCTITDDSIFDTDCSDIGTNPVCSEYISKAIQDPAPSSTSTPPLRYTYVTCNGNADFLLYTVLEGGTGGTYFWIKSDGTSGDGDASAGTCG